MILIIHSMIWSLRLHCKSIKLSGLTNSKITNVTSEAIDVAPVATLNPPSPNTTINAVLKAIWAIGATTADNLAIK